MPSHVNLAAVRRIIKAGCLIWCFGDSRTVWQFRAVPGAIFRTWDVQWAGIIFAGQDGNAFSNDGIGSSLYLNYDLTIQVGAPGDTLTQSGMVNRYPCTVSERFCPTASGNTNTYGFGIDGAVNLTADVAMNTSESGGTTGTFKRGHPQQGRTIASIENWAVANNSGRFLKRVLAMEYNFEIDYPWAYTMESAPFAVPTGSTANPEITVQTWTQTKATGTGQQIIYAKEVLPVDQYSNKGWTWAGIRFNFTGGEGCLLDTCAQGGWSLSDHLPATVYTTNDNTDWKYSQAALNEYYAKCLRATRCLIRWEVGANVSPGNTFEADATEIKSSTLMAVTRAITAAAAGGATDIVVELVSYWGSEGDTGGPSSRSSIWQAALRALAVEQGWSFYDQLGELQARGHTDGNALKEAYRRDSAHQNFDGMVLLGPLEWRAINGGAAPRGRNLRRRGR